MISNGLVGLLPLCLSVNGSSLVRCGSVSLVAFSGRAEEEEGRFQDEQREKKREGEGGRGRGREMERKRERKREYLWRSQVHPAWNIERLALNDAGDDQR